MPPGLCAIWPTVSVAPEGTCDEAVVMTHNTVRLYRASTLSPGLKPSRWTEGPATRGTGLPEDGTIVTFREFASIDWTFPSMVPVPESGTTFDMVGFCCAAT